MTRAVIIAGGDLDIEAPGDLIGADDLIIAADGGLAHAFALGLMPAIVVGDLDSAPRELVQVARNRGAEVIVHEVRKDKTDLELAVDVAVDRGAEEIVILGALGGRIDHTLAAIMLITRGMARGTVRIVSRDAGIAVVHGKLGIRGSAGDTVSLLALSERASGVTTRGLDYALEDGDLVLGSSLGVSNVMTAGEASVSVDDGTVLAIHLTSHADGSAEADIGTKEAPRLVCPQRGT